ncbi:Beta-1,3-galactosyltransferase 4 [Phytophthora pseudosyringae]|uniref:Hexosyltransferase n=1 Tax=Phytophthora pseudosyringae TaxID=221518 RepID=A0A8T1WI83_9STRA|nr:Beta-1,3-galactosyltransferase 4 [Phytophthora pseudosyringae]
MRITVGDFQRRGINVWSTSPQWLSRNDDIDGEVVNDPLWGVKIVYPVEGAIEKSPVEFQVQINVHPGGEKRFAAEYDGARFCVEVNGVTTFCSKLNELGRQYDQPGNCTARAYLQVPGDSYGTKIQSLSAPVSFTLVNETEFDVHIARQLQKNNEKLRTGFQLSLLEWVQLQQREQDNEILLKLQRDLGTEGFQGKEEESDKLLLVIGVRTAGVSHFPFRQAIRETWASPSALPEGVKVLFLGCRPRAVVPDEDPNEEAQLRRTWEAIELEKQVYGDLLTDEMDCDDDYLQLADKTKEFLHLAATRYSHAQYVMVADDDIYLRLDEIARWLRSLGPRERFYAGQVREIENARKTPPTRAAGSPHYLSEQVYPLNELPPHAGLKVPFFPSNETVAEYSRRLCAQARLHFPGAVTTCTDFRDQLRSALRLSYNDELL